MTETTKDIILAFCDRAKSDAIRLGIRRWVKFTYEGIIADGELKGSDKSVGCFYDFTGISADFRLHQIVRMLRSVSYSAEGTTVVFVHTFAQELVEKLVSFCGFRVYEHFSVRRVVSRLCAEQEDSEISYCLAVKK